MQAFVLLCSSLVRVPLFATPFAGCGTGSAEQSGKAPTVQALLAGIQQFRCPPGSALPPPRANQTCLPALQPLHHTLGRRACEAAFKLCQSGSCLRWPCRLSLRVCSLASPTPTARRSARALPPAWLGSSSSLGRRRTLTDFTARSRKPTPAHSYAGNDECSHYSDARGTA